LVASLLTRRLRAILLLLVLSAALAALLGFTAWHLLPYETLERDDAVTRFALWEAAMWMAGLALGLFGLAAWFGATDTGTRHGDFYLDRSPDFIRHQVRLGIEGNVLFSDLPAIPWLMIGSGLLLVLEAVMLRSMIYG